jgi:hypothetical protein
MTKATGLVVSGMMVGFCRWRFVHHPQHFWPSGFQKTPHQNRRYAEEGDVEPSRVIPANMRLDDPG